MKTEALGEMIRKLLLEELRGVRSFATGGDLVGFSPIEKIRGALLHWVAVPFNGVDVFCQLRCPNATQLEQCGDVSNLVMDAGERQRALTADEITTLRNYQEAVCKAVFNVPTFDEIGAIISDGDFVIANKRKALREIAERFAASKNEMTVMEQQALHAQIKTLELELGFILPDDTMAFITQWAMGNDVSDVKRVTRQQLLRAAALAKAANRAPSDYMSGVYTDFNRAEIDAQAWLVLGEHMKDAEEMKKGRRTMRFGGRGG